MKDSSRINNVPFIDKVAYGAGNTGYALVFQCINTYLVFYATAILNIPGTYVGLAIAVSVIWDGFTDPIMGYISDHTRFLRLGRRHFYLLIGTCFVALSNYYLWIIEAELNLNLKFTYLLLYVILVKTFLTIYGTPYTALGAELSSDYHERNSIQGVRTVFFLIGLFLASTIGMLLFFKPTKDYPLGQLNPLAYRNIGLLASIIMLISGIVCFLKTFKYIPNLYKNKKVNNINKNIKNPLKKLFIELFSVLKNKDYLVVVLAYLFTNLASAIISVIGLHVFTFTFQMNNTAIAIIIGTQFICSIISQPFWVFIAKKIDKKPAAILGLYLSLVASFYLLLAVFFREYIIINYLYLLPFALIIGIGTGGLFTLPLSMIADIADVEELKTNKRLEGVYYGCLTFVYKSSQSLAVFFLGVLLDLIGFNPQLTVQNEITVISLGMSLSLGGIISFSLALFTYKKYQLDYKTLKQIQRKLKLKNIN